MMFRALVVLTSLVLSVQGAYELAVRRQPLGLLLLAVSVVVAGVGAAADPYMAELERRRRKRRES
jgi:type IV secretory pathway TrbD component